MRCTNWQIAKRAAAFGIAAVLALAARADSGDRPHVLVIDDATVGQALVGRFDYIGKWQHVHGKRDGRSNGTSTRSTHTGDVAILSFNGTRVRLYGVRGRSGGRAGIALDQTSTGGPVDFYASHLIPYALIYQSPLLPAGVHTITVAVWGTRDVRGHYYYVNIDGAEVDP
jgi:hypothetical protein